MVTSAEIRKRLKTQPFRPFRIVTKSGQAYDVPHPNFVMVMPRKLVVGFAATADDDIPDGFHFVSVRSITTLLTIPTPISRKGAKAQRAKTTNPVKDMLRDLLRAFA